jgi:hypothetical protein
MGLGSRAFRRAEILLVHKGLLRDYCLQVGLKLLVRHLHRIYLAMYVRTHSLDQTSSRDRIGPGPEMIC